MSTAHISKPFLACQNALKVHLQQCIISKFSGGGPPDPPLQGEGRGGAGGRKGREGRGGVQGRPRLKRGRGEGRGGKGKGREGKVGRKGM